MAAAIKINLFNKQQDERLWQTAENFVGEPDKAYVFSHGSPNTIYDDRSGKGANSKPLTPLELAKMLEAAGASTNTKVFLHSCSTAHGYHSFARELSKYFIEVEGATRILVANNALSESEFREVSRINGYETSGRAFTAGEEATIVTQNRAPGRMKQMHAVNYAFSLAHPELIDTPESELPASNPYTHIDKFNGINQYTMSNDRRDIGDEQPINTPVKSTPILPSEVTTMAITYINTVTKDSERKLAQVKYPELELAYAYHDKMMQHAVANKMENLVVFENAINKTITNNILMGKFVALYDLAKQY